MVGSWGFGDYSGIWMYVSGIGYWVNCIGNRRGNRWKGREKQDIGKNTNYGNTQDIMNENGRENGSGIWKRNQYLSFNDILFQPKALKLTIFSDYVTAKP